MLVALLLLAFMGPSACTPSGPLVGVWEQTGVVGDDGVYLPVPESEAVVLELQRGGKATVMFPQADGKGDAFAWEYDDDTLKMGDPQDWDVRTVYELDYELGDDSLTMEWMYGPPRRVFERR